MNLYYLVNIINYLKKFSYLRLKMIEKLCRKKINISQYSRRCNVFSKKNFSLRHL